ncbi:MAG: nucleotide exchange factor GrpE [bacterium]|nr:MAG: nucleotide exchange factor GrpE [bacterium]
MSQNTEDTLRDQSAREYDGRDECPDASDEPGECREEEAGYEASVNNFTSAQSDDEDIVDKSKRLIEKVITEKGPQKKGSAGKGKTAEKPDMQKRMKRATRKELLELIQRKNETLQKMEKTVNRAAQEVVAKEDKIIRMAAEFENYKKRTRREWELLQQKANAELIKNILGVLDDFDRAFEAVGDNEDHFHHGIRMIYNSLLETLRRAGLKEIDAMNKRFDPQFHEAVGEAESEEVEAECVAHVVQKGYLFNDIVLRPTKVIVAKEKKN